MGASSSETSATIYQYTLRHIPISILFNANEVLVDYFFIFSISLMFFQITFATLGKALNFNAMLKVHYAFKFVVIYEGWNFNSGNYLFTTDTK